MRDYRGECIDTCAICARSLCCSRIRTCVRTCARASCMRAGARVYLCVPLLLTVPTCIVPSAVPAACHGRMICRRKLSDGRWLVLTLRQPTISMTWNNQCIIHRGPVLRKAGNLFWFHYRPRGFSYTTCQREKEVFVSELHNTGIDK